MTRLKIDLSKIDEIEAKLRSITPAARLGVEKELIVFDVAVLGIDRVIPALDLYVIEKNGDKYEICAYRWYPSVDEYKRFGQTLIDLMNDVKCARVKARVYGNRILMITEVEEVEELDITELIKFGVASKSGNHVWIDVAEDDKVNRYLLSDRTLKGAKLCGYLSRRAGAEIHIAFIAHTYQSRRGYTVIQGIHFMELPEKRRPEEYPREELGKEMSERSEEEEAETREIEEEKLEKSNREETDSESTVLRETASSEDGVGSENTSSEEVNTSEMGTTQEADVTASNTDMHKSPFELVIDAVVDKKLEKKLGDIIGPGLAAKLAELIAILDEDRQSRCRDRVTPADVILCLLDQLTEDDLKTARASKVTVRTLKNRISENMAKINELLLKP